MGCWAAGDVRVGQHRMELSVAQREALLAARRVLSTWCALKASPLSHLLHLLQSVEGAGGAHTQANAAAAEDVGSSDMPPNAPAHASAAPSDDSTNVLLLYRKIGSTQGPPATFSDACPHISEMEVRMLDASVPDVAALLCAVLRGRPELEPAPFPPLQEVDVAAAAQALNWLATHGAEC